MDLRYRCLSFLTVLSGICATPLHVSYGSQMENSVCSGYECGPGQECYVREFPCLRPPCPQLPGCRSVTNDPCIQVRCRDGTRCVDGKCVTHPSPSCEEVKCRPGEKCYLVETDCEDGDCQLTPVCRRMDICEYVRCREGFYCYDGRCHPNQVCDDIDCEDDEECYLEDVECFQEPGFPVPTCRKIDMCRFTKCASGFYCYDGQCLANPTCERVVCGPGEECYMTENEDCYQEPCFPVPICVPVDLCVFIYCDPGYYCLNEVCIPNPPCYGADCGTSERRY